MEMKPSLSASANQMQDLHAEHHHHHQSNLALTRPGYEKHASCPNSTNNVANVMPRVEVADGAAAHSEHVCTKGSFFHNTAAALVTNA